MVYLIYSPGFTIDKVTGKKTYFDLLKIGFSKDDETAWGNRVTTYKLHNPTINVLYEIPGLTKKDEKTIQYSFKNLLYPGYGREWFTWDKSIVDFFDNLSKVSELERKNIIGSLLVPVNPSAAPIKSSGRDFIQDNRAKLPIVLARVLSSDELKGVVGIDNILLEAFQNHATDFPSLLNYLRKKYDDSIIDDYLERDRIINLPENKEVKELLEKYYNSIHSQRLRLLCETKLKKELMNILLNQIPDKDEIKIAYLMLGPEKIKAMYYNMTEIRKKIGIKTFCKDSLISLIYKDARFKLGNRIECSEVKSILSEIYEKEGYKKIAKATDLESYFEIKEVLLSIIEKDSGKKKRARGYEILDYKKDSENFNIYQKYLKDQSFLQQNQTVDNDVDNKLE